MKIPISGFELTLDLEVSATWHAARRGLRERGSGIQLEPDEPAHWEVHLVKIGDKDITAALSDDDLDRLCEQLGEQEDWRE